MALPVADLQSYGQTALARFEPLVSSARSLIATGAEVGVLLTLVCVTLLWLRARRGARKYREELASLLSVRTTVESADRANAEFIASMIHQIRTPMNAIVGFIDLALKADLDPELREHLDAVRTSADWLMHIENDALESSCIEADGLPLDNVPFSISECIRAAMKIVELEAAAKKLVTGCRIDPKLPEVVCGDPIRFRHLIFNLLDYAVRNTARGSITLSAVLETNSADNILVRVAITDTGVGIAPANRPLLAESFRHADVSAALRSDPTGFGLVISRRLVDLMGGTIGFQSQLGAGSTVEFTVRFEKQKIAAARDVPVHAPDAEEALVMPDYDVLEKSNQSAEIVRVLVGLEASYSNSDNGSRGANARLSAPAGLALLEASGGWTQRSPPPVEPAGDPFAQARKSLSKSSFGIRVIHNDGDPSDRDLI
jgi:signal transduction histidine kinase